MGVRAEPIYTQNSCKPPSCLSTCTHRTFPRHRRRGSGRTTCPPSRAPRTSGPPTRVASGTGTRPSSRPCPTSTPTSSTSSASSSHRCSTGPAEPELPPSPLSFPTHTIGSSLWATPTCPSTPRSTAPTEPRLPACPKLQTWHPITHHEPWFFFPKFHFRTQGWEAIFWPRTEIVPHPPPPLLVVRLEFRLTRRIDDNVY